MAARDDMVIFVDEDGDEFPVWREGRTDTQLQDLAEHYIQTGSWRPNGNLTQKLEEG